MHNCIQISYICATTVLNRRYCRTENLQKRRQITTYYYYVSSHYKEDKLLVRRNQCCYFMKKVTGHQGIPISAFFKAYQQHSELCSNRGDTPIHKNVNANNTCIHLELSCCVTDNMHDASSKSL